MNFFSIVQSKVFKNASWLIGARIAQMAINFVVGLLTARFLGPSNFGLVNYGMAYTSLFFSFCTLGLNSIIVKELIDNPNEEGCVLGTAMGLKLIASAFSVITILCASFIVDHDEPLTRWVVALCSIGVIFNILETFNYWFQSKLCSKVTAVTTFLGYFATAIYKVILIVLGKSVVYFALATSIDYVIVGALLFFAYKRHGGLQLSFSLPYGKKMLSRSVHFILPGLMVAIYSQTDRIMLKHMMGNSEIAFYSTALSICTIWCFVLSAIIDSMTPIIIQMFNRNFKEFERLNRVLYAIVFYLSCFVSFLLCLLAEPLILHLFGNEFRGAILPMKVVTWLTAFSYFGVARNAWVICQSVQKYLIVLYSAAAFLNVFLNVLLIPKYGAVGASIASLLAQISTTMIVPFFIKAFRRNSVLILESIVLKNVIRR